MCGGLQPRRKDERRWLNILRVDVMLKRREQKGILKRIDVKRKSIQAANLSKKWFSKPILNELPKY